MKKDDVVRYKRDHAWVVVDECDLFEKSDDGESDDITVGDVTFTLISKSDGCCTYRVRTKSRE